MNATCTGTACSDVGSFAIIMGVAGGGLCLLLLLAFMLKYCKKNRQVVDATERGAQNAQRRNNIRLEETPPAREPQVQRRNVIKAVPDRDIPVGVPAVALPTNLYKIDENEPLIDLPLERTRPYLHIAKEKDAQKQGQASEIIRSIIVKSSPAKKESPRPDFHPTHEKTE
jgi:hypothetical protein